MAYWKLWSKSEDAKLVKFYSTIASKPETIIQFGVSIGRTPRACINRAVLLKLTSVKNRGCKPSTGENNHAWRGDDACDSSKRLRAQRMFQLGACERCGKPGVERHHKDGNPGHNTRKNIMIVCRRCHMVLDGRLERVAKILKELASEFKPLKPCSCCKRPFKPLRRGRCQVCYSYFMRTGVERSSVPGLKPVSEAIGYDPDFSIPRSARKAYRKP